MELLIKGKGGVMETEKKEITKDQIIKELCIGLSSFNKGNTHFAYYVFQSLLDDLRKEQKQPNKT